MTVNTVSQGKGGSLTVTANDSVELTGRESGLFAATVNAGNAGELMISTGRLLIREQATVSTSTFGSGNAGNLRIRASEIDLSGASAASSSSITSQVNSKATGNGGNLTIETGRLIVRNGGEISASTFGTGDAGDLRIRASESVELTGTSPLRNVPVGVFTQSNSDALGNAGNLTIDTNRLIVQGGSQVSSATFSRNKGQGGNLTVNASESVEVTGTSAFGIPSRLITRTYSNGNAGDVTITTKSLSIQDGAEVSAATFERGKGGNIQVRANSLSLNHSGSINSSSEGQGIAGNININLHDTLQANNNSGISTNATSASGGNINITAKDIRLRNNSDIKTNSSAANGGNINITANTIIALEDSDILAFAPKGQGGNITFNTRAFLSSPLYRPTSPTTNAATLEALNGNNRVDVNASGAVSGTVTGVPDITFLQNSLTKLQQNPIDTNALIANSCIARSGKQQGTFIITGTGGLPYRPGDTSPSTYPTGTVRGVNNSSINNSSLKFTA